MQLLVGICIGFFLGVMYSSRKNNNPTREESKSTKNSSIASDFNDFDGGSGD